MPLSVCEYVHVPLSVPGYVYLPVFVCGCVHVPVSVCVYVHVLVSICVYVHEPAWVPVEFKRGVCSTAARVTSACGLTLNSGPLQACQVHLTAEPPL